MKHIALTLVSAAVLALPVGAVHAQQSGAKKPAATKKAPAKKPARKAPAKTVKAVEANTPVQTPSDRLTDAGIRTGDDGRAAVEPEGGHVRARHQNSVDTSTASMSVKVWLSPAIDQMKA